jgi:hypothetical protein
MSHDVPGYLIHSPVIGNTSAPGPGSPVTPSIVEVPVAGSQNVATSAPLPVFGYAGSGNGGVGGAAWPMRTICPPFAVGKQGSVVSLEQHTWLTPPFVSMHCPSAVVEAQAGPVQRAVHVPAPQLSSSLAPHGFGPASVDVPVVVGSVMVSVPAGTPAGTQSEESVKRLFPSAAWTVTTPSVRHD